VVVELPAPDWVVLCCCVDEVVVPAGLVVEVLPNDDEVVDGTWLVVDDCAPEVTPVVAFAVVEVEPDVAEVEVVVADFPVVAVPVVPAVVEEVEPEVAVV